MHAMFFGLKRAHLRVLGITHELLDGLMLTPARFDMMRIIDLHREHGILQGKLQDLLGVSAPTVSVMLRSLELLGFVKRSRFERDERCLLVQITEVGAWELARAVSRLISSGLAELVALNGLSDDTEEAADEVSCVRSYLRRIRWNYGDSTPFEHPWTLQQILPSPIRSVRGKWGTFELDPDDFE